MSKRFASCGPSARSPTQSLATRDAVVHAHRVDGAGANAAGRRAAGKHDRVDALGNEMRGRDACRRRPRPASCGPRVRPLVAERIDHLAGMRLLGQVAQPRHLLAPHAGIRAIIGIDDAGEDNRQLRPAEEGKQRLRRFYRVEDVAAAEYIRIGEAVDEIDDQQRRQPAEADLLAELLLAVDVFVSCSLPIPAARRNGAATW